jgi:hypothetical protein
VKIKIELQWQQIPHQGYTIYGMDVAKRTKLYCKWWAYPIFGIGMALYHKKLHLYHFLNDVGIMRTPPYCHMRLKDIWSPYS